MPGNDNSMKINAKSSGIFYCATIQPYWFSGLMVDGNRKTWVYLFLCMLPGIIRR